MKKWTVVLLLVAIVLGVMCMLDVSESRFVMAADSIGASWYPRIVGFCLIVSAAALLVFTLIRGADTPLDTIVDIRTLLTLALSAGYVLGICYVGFMISTLIYLMFLTFIFDNLSLASWRGIIIYSVTLTFAFYCFFRFFKVYLPDTILF